MLFSDKTDSDQIRLDRLSMTLPIRKPNTELRWKSELAHQTVCPHPEQKLLQKKPPSPSHHGLFRGGQELHLSRTPGKINFQYSSVPVFPGKRVANDVIVAQWKTDCWRRKTITAIIPAKRTENKKDLPVIEVKRCKCLCPSPMPILNTHASRPFKAPQLRLEPQPASTITVLFLVMCLFFFSAFRPAGRMQHCRPTRHTQRLIYNSRTTYPPPLLSRSRCPKITWFQSPPGEGVLSFSSGAAILKDAPDMHGFNAPFVFCRWFGMVSAFWGFGFGE